MIAARLYALGGGRRRPEPTGACELDLDQLLASGVLEAPARRSLWQRIVSWLRGVGS